MKVLAHRGASRVARENTLEAFARAVEMGADGVELDVHRTNDGALVVHHDPDAGELGLLGERSHAEVRAALPHVPTLAEVLDVCAGLLVNVEIKNLPGWPGHDPEERAADAVVALVQERERRDDVLVSSFGIDAVDRTHALDGRVATGLLTILGTDPLEALTLAHQHGHRSLHPDARALRGPVARALVERAGELGLAIYPWTVDDPDEIRRLAAAGVDGVITNVPDVARRALESD
jgi:glycerophosphoryl diester phosphodiesterase